MLGTPNAKLIFGTEPIIEIETSRSQKAENVIASSDNSEVQGQFTCSALVKQIGASELHKVSLSPINASGGAVHAVFLNAKQKVPAWIKPGISVSVDYKNGDGFAGKLHFRRGRTDFAKQNQLGPDFFVSEAST
jgi:hypothetical protein